ncbi:thioredoxin domain-containing protein [Parabacteroides sp. OttesenSCG-928-G21]|nr:thioredoxin domain-containing protein [Parabacteroides sp. OttesenSCG-928-G21]
MSNYDSQILFGKPDAQLIITILTNPFCNPCAKMHVRIKNLIKETKGNVCVQYIFSSFNESLEYANRYLIAVYLEKDWNMALSIFGNWFENGQLLKELFFKDLQLDMTNPAIEAEFQKHESWKEKTQLHATPTILINGYQLPANYKIEDLQYFTEFKVNAK